MDPDLDLKRTYHLIHNNIAYHRLIPILFLFLKYAEINVKLTRDLLVYCKAGRKHIR